MALVGGVEFEVAPAFKTFEQKLSAGVKKAAEVANRKAPAFEPKVNLAGVEKGLGRLGDLTRVIAGAALVASLTKAVSTGAELFKTVAGIARITGDSVEETSRLVFVLERLGISADEATPGIRILGRNIQQGGENFRKYFDAATLAELKTNSFSENIPILAREYQKLNKGQERTTFLLNAFGRAGTTFGKLLEKDTAELKAIADEAERFGLVLDETNAEAFKEFIVSSRAAAQAGKGLQVAFGQLVLPVMESFNKVAISALTTITNLPDPLQKVAGVVLIAGVGFGKYAQALDIGIRNSVTFIKFVRNKVLALIADRAATTAATVATGAEVAATDALVVAHQRAAAAAFAHARAERGVAAAAGTAAVASSTAAATQTAAAGGVGGGLLASVTGIAVGALAIGTGIITGILAGAAIALTDNPISRFIEENIADPLAAALVPDLDTNSFASVMNDLTAVIERELGPGTKEATAGIDQVSLALNTLRDEGKLTPAVLDALARPENIKRIREMAAAGTLTEEAVIALGEAAQEAADKTAELAAKGPSIADFSAAVLGVQAANKAASDAQSAFEGDLSNTQAGSEAASNAIAHYAAELFKVKEAAAAAAGEEFNVAEAIAASAAEATKAAEEFREEQKKRAEAAKEANEKVADAQENLNETIREGQERIADAEEALQEAILDRIERRKDAEEALAEAKADAAEQAKDGQEQLADFEREARERTKDGIKQIRDAEKNLLDVRQQSADAIRDANISLEEAIISGDAAAVNRAQAALTDARINGAESVKGAEEDIAKARLDAQKEERDTLRERKRLEEELKKARLDALKQIREAQQALKDAIVEANKRVKDAQEAVAEARKDAAKANAEAKEQLIELTAEAKKYADEAERAARAWERARDAQQSSVDATAAFFAQGGFPGLAHGGDIPPGGAFVGEEGIEFVRGPGHVTSNDDLARALERKSGAAVTNNVTINEVAGSPRATWRKIEPFLVRGVNV